MSKSRAASHAGTWYSAKKSQLNEQLTSWLKRVEMQPGHVRAIIAPHAGYDYCGSCGAHAYRQINPEKIKRVFILGPSHHVRMSDCSLSQQEVYKTPFYDLPIDQDIYRELLKTDEFGTMNLTTDEDEHSIEMHLPYIAKVMESRKRDYKIVPILVGSISFEKEQRYGQILSKYLADPDNLFVISSDFCHWGHRFRYTYYDKSFGDIYQSIEHLDKKGMDLISELSPKPFHDYLKEYQNTICGRHPITVLLAAVADLHNNGNKYKFQFLDYKQSSQCRRSEDSSVSYAAGVLYKE